MEKITRRAALTAIPACGLAPIVPAMAGPLDDKELADNLARELVAVMGRLHPHKSYRYMLDHNHGYAFIVGDLKSHVLTDDGSPLLADDVTGTTAYADWEQSQA